MDTVFDLIGDLENDITKSIAWVFTKCPLFLKNIIKSLIAIDVSANDIVIRY